MLSPLLNWGFYGARLCIPQMCINWFMQEVIKSLNVSLVVAAISSVVAGDFVDP